MLIVICLINFCLVLSAILKYTMKKWVISFDQQRGKINLIWKSESTRKKARTYKVCYWKYYEYYCNTEDCNFLQTDTGNQARLHFNLNFIWLTAYAGVDAYLQCLWLYCCYIFWESLPKVIPQTTDSSLHFFSDLTKHVVKDYEGIENLMVEGNTNR